MKKNVLVLFSSQNGAIKPIDKAVKSNVSKTLNLDDYNCTLPIVELASSNGWSWTGTLDGADELVDGIMFLAHFQSYSAISDVSPIASDGYAPVTLNINDMGDKSLYRYDSMYFKTNTLNYGYLYDTHMPVVYYGGAFYLLSLYISAGGSGYTPPSPIDSEQKKAEETAE